MKKTNKSFLVFIAVLFLLSFFLPAPTIQAGELIQPVQTSNKKEPPAKFTRKTVKRTINPLTQKTVSATEEETTPPAWFDVEDLRRHLTYDHLRVRPRYRQEFELDSNILLDSVDRKMDFIFREIPGVEAVLPFGNHFIWADYQAQFNQFVKYPRESFIAQSLKTEAAFNFTNSFLKLSDEIVDTSERSGTTFTDHIPRFENTVDVTGGYQWNRLMWEVGYKNFVRDYDTSREMILNYHFNQIHTRQYWDLTEKTKFLIDYKLTDYDYSNDANRDTLSNAVSAGIKGYLFPKTSLFSSFGYEHQNYSTAGQKDANNFIGEVGVQYIPLVGTVFDAGWKRGVEQSTFVNTNFLIGNEFFLKYTQRIIQKLSLISEVNYTDQDYGNVTTLGAGAFQGRRNDDIFMTNAKLLYEFTDWASADIRYQYSRRNSNASIFDYTDNLVTLGLSFKT